MKKLLKKKKVKEEDNGMYSALLVDKDGFRRIDEIPGPYPMYSIPTHKSHYKTALAPRLFDGVIKERGTIIDNVRNFRLIRVEGRALTYEEV